MPEIETSPTRSESLDVETLTEIQQRMLWLAVRMVHEANLTDAGGIKVGGHQASSASMVSIMAALWFAHIGGDDKVAIKPHASPVYHAIKYLTGELDRSYLKRLRAPGGLQAYPSRTKDPDVADFSTGSVGLGAVAPIFSAATRRYVDAHFDSRGSARFIATVGDAELDEGNVWEAIVEPAIAGLGNVMLIVDLNRQSLDRVIPDIQAIRLEKFFENAGWHVVEAKYGSRLESAFATPGGEDLRRHIDGMSNEEYQSLFGLPGDDLRLAFLRTAPRSVSRLVDDYDDTGLADLVFDLGGHDLGLLVDRYRECDAATDRPSVVFAYTVKGWGLPMAGGASQPRGDAVRRSDQRFTEAGRGSVSRQSGIASTLRAKPASCAIGSVSRSTTSLLRLVLASRFPGRQPAFRRPRGGRPRKPSAGFLPGWLIPRLCVIGSSRHLPTYRSPPISADGSTRRACSLMRSGRTSAERSAFSSGLPRRAGITSS